MTLADELILALRECRLRNGERMQARMRLHVADSLGISLAAHRLGTLADSILAALAAGSGDAGCSVIGSSRRLPPAAAAFANAALAHLLDYDDIHDEARLHPTTVCLPAALAAAEHVGASGGSVVDATLLGNELMCRLGVMCAPKGQGPGSDWFLTQLFGYFGAAVSAGHVLGLSDASMVSALGFAYMQAAGGKEAGFGVGSNARSIYPAFAAMGGVNAALLAQAGLSGPAGALDGDAGLFRLYLGGMPGADALAILLDTQRWYCDRTSIKPWPSCRLSHPYVAVALSMREQLQGRTPRRVVAAVNASAAKLCRPLHERRRPRTLQDAKYSIPFMTAFTLVHGRVDLSTLDERCLSDEAVLELAARVEIDERLPDKPGHPPAELDLEFEHERLRSRAMPDFEMSDRAIEAKFHDCLAYAGADARQAAALWSATLALGAAPVRDWLRAQPVLDRR